MPTIIDSLIVRLGLDSKNLTQQAVPAAAALDGIESKGKETTSTILGLGRALGSMLAVIGGTVAIRKFVEDFIDANAELDRFSKNIGLNVSTVSAFGKAVEETGGNFKSALGTLDMFSRAQTELQLTGESGLIPYLSALGVSLSGVGGKARPVDDVLLDLASSFEKMDRTKANNMGRMMGIDQDTMNLLLRGRKEVETTIARQKEYNAVNRAQAEEASKLQRVVVALKQSYSAFGRELLMAAVPALEKMLGFLEKVAEWGKANSEFVKDFLLIIGTGLAAVALASLPLTGTIAIVTALAAAIALLYQDYKTWERGGDSLIDWAKWKPGIDAAIEGIEQLGKVAKDTFGFLRDLASVAIKLATGDIDGAAAANNRMRDNLREKMGISKDATASEVNDHFRDNARSRMGISKDATASELNDHFRDNVRSRMGISKDATASEVNDHFRDNARSNLGLSSAKNTLGEAIAHIEGFYAKTGNKPDRPQRNHNPGNIQMGKFARNHGAIGDDGRFAIFPDDATGKAALYALLQTSAYSKLTVPEAVARFAPPKENDTAKYTRYILQSTGASASQTVGDFMGRVNNTNGGKVDRSVQTTIGQVTVNTQATDAAGISKDMAKSLDYSFAAQANAGLD